MIVFKSKSKSAVGFTLMEILILIGVMGILAAVIFPEYSRATTQGRNAALLSDLRMVRHAIELYRLDHGGVDPGEGGNGSWAQCLLVETDTGGNVYTDAMAGAGVKSFGPYLDGLPVNPFNGLDTVRIDGERAGADTDGWRFDSVTGGFVSDDSGFDDRGVPHKDL